MHNTADSRRHSVVLTDPIDRASHDALSQAARVRIVPVDDARWSVCASEASIIIVRSPIPPSLPEQARKLLGFVRYGAGVDMIPVAEASNAGIAVANAPNANSNSVAEYAIGQMLNLARKLALTDQTLRHAGWHAARQLASSCIDLSGKTVAIVGMGNIGTQLARKCHAGFDMKVLAVRRSIASSSGPFASTSLDDALAQADVVVLACPLSEQTTGLIDAKRLSLMKPAAWLINISRGPVVDEGALIDALEKGRLGGAALDVFEEEPLSPGSPLFFLPNVLLSPHVAGITRESLGRIGELATEQTLTLLAGRLPRYLVNREAEAAIRARLAHLLTCA